jgi:hypothetical protein
MHRRRFGLFLIALCGFAGSFADYPVKAFGDYPNAIKQSGLAAVAVPLDDSKEQRQYFGIDLSSKGFIPVLLILENQDATESILLAKDALNYRAGGKSGLALPEPEKAGKKDKALAVASYYPIYGLLAHVARTNAKEIRQNIQRKELQSITLAPGASNHGFIFVRAHWSHSHREPTELTIPFKRSDGQEIDLVLTF